MIKFILFALMLALGISHASPNHFYAGWSDGQAELSGYALQQPRYGQMRHGQAVLIYVTEPFSHRRKVKVDRYDPADPDHFVALKLNFIRRFQTGVYDYAIMTSLFADPRQSMRTVKQTFSSQEWCGQVYEELIFDTEDVKVDTRSYFEGESQRATLKANRAMSVDGLWLAARGLTTGGPNGVTLARDMIGSSIIRRLKHLPPRVFAAQPRWLGPVSTMKTRAGEFKIKTLTFTRQDQVQCQLNVELAKPHRIIGWHCTDGERATLLGSTRLAYWTHARLGDETLLKDLGLAPMAPKTPELSPIK
ncbi:MAG: hypothetical protein CMH52_08825 [Myxococcales bacterium]|nr:hypothetical protein [Myxococcales bacterium]